MIKERIIQLVEYKDIPKEDFYKKIGMTSASFRGNAKKTPLNSNAIENIFSIIPDVSPEWLLTGKGEMLRNEQNNTVLRALRTDKLVEQQDIPLYNMEVAAGLVELFNDSAQTAPAGYISIPNLPKCDGALYVRGDSMYPLLKSGDIVAYKQVNNIRESIFWGEMYLIDMACDGDEYTTIKYIHKADDPEQIRLVSHNQHHAPKDIHISSIRALALVKASVRFNTIN